MENFCHKTLFFILPESPIHMRHRTWWKGVNKNPWNTLEVGDAT